MEAPRRMSIRKKITRIIGIAKIKVQDHELDPKVAEILLAKS